MIEIQDLFSSWTLSFTTCCCGQSSATVENYSFSKLSKQAIDSLIN
jgi:hypothetical protein